MLSLIERISAAGDEPILWWDGTAISGSDIAARSDRIAGGLRAAGIRRGDRIAAILPNGADWYLILAACARLGVAIVSLNSRIGTKEAGDLIARTRSKAVVYDPDLRGGAVDRMLRGIAADKLATLRVTVPVTGDAPPLTNDARAHSLRQLEEVGGDYEGGQLEDPLFIMPTSGTTSAPKLVVHSQERIMHHGGDVAASFRLDARSKILVAIPLCGAFGFTTALTAIAGGCPVILFDGFDAAAIAGAIDRHAVTHMTGTNDMLAALLAHISDARPFPSLRMYGHANFTPGLNDLPAEAESRGIMMRGMYGMSETMAFVAAQPWEAPLQVRAEAGGELICPEAEMRVVDVESGRPVKAGEVGELEIRTPDCMIEYFEDRERTSETFTADGFLRTGDLAVCREGGRFDFVSRKGDILRIGGYLVSPAEIEDVIKAAGPVAACQVVAVTYLERVRPVAFVVAEDGQQLSEQVLLSACSALAVYKRPIRIFTIEAMPTVDGPNGAKVRKNDLRDLALERLEREAAR